MKAKDSDDRMSLEVVEIIIDDDDFEEKSSEVDADISKDEQIPDSSSRIENDSPDKMPIDEADDAFDDDGYSEGLTVSEEDIEELDDYEDDCVEDDDSILPKKKSKKSFTSVQKIQIIVAAFLTVVVLIAYPTYSWFNHQREIARLERIKSPDSLYITAANREDKININMNEIDVNSTWNADTDELATYKYFVFSVAGQYVVDYNLQLAHTKNNNYKYEIFEAEASNTRLDGDEGKDYIVYNANNERIPADLREIGTHDGINTNLPIYYSIKEDDNDKQVSLNAGTTYTIGSDTFSFNGHYLNMGSGTSEYTKLANNTYHDKTYSYSLTESHSEPLYWQVTGIQVEDTEDSKDPFYHEYILKVSWDTTANLADLSKYKDTDIVYITVSVQ